MKKNFMVVGFLVAIGLAMCIGFYVGRKTAKPVIGRTVYATIEEINTEHKYLIVQGLDVNDINGRGRFQISISDQTILEWRYTKVSFDDLKLGDQIAFTYAGEVLEISPALVYDVLKVVLLRD